MLNIPVQKCRVLLFLSICISTVLYFYIYIYYYTPADLRFNSVQPTTNVAEAPVTLFMRMTGLHIKRFYCDFLRTLVLFWPASYGKLVLLFDQESSLDHKLANILERQFHQSFPDRKLEILYEPLPTDYETLLKLPWPKRGYNRQIWSSFFNDLYTNDSVIAWVDSDTAFSTSVTRESIYNGTRLRVIGTDCTLQQANLARRCVKNAEIAIGLPAVADFMLHFPIFIYRDTYANCRKYLMQRYKARSFEEVYKKISSYDLISPVTIILNYAWHFERDRYDWSLKICSASPKEYNKRFQANATIRPYDIQPVMVTPQASIHTGKPRSALAAAQLILASYCLSHKAASHNLTFCTGKRDLPLSNNLILFKYVEAPFPCNGTSTSTCLDVLRNHYNLVGSEILENKRRMEWSDVEIVEKLVNKINTTCSVIHNGRPGGKIPIA